MGGVHNQPLGCEVLSVKIGVSFVQAYAEPGPVKVQLFSRAVFIVRIYFLMCQQLLALSCLGVCGLYIFSLTADVP